MQACSITKKKVLCTEICLECTPVLAILSTPHSRRPLVISEPEQVADISWVLTVTHTGSNLDIFVPDNSVCFTSLDRDGCALYKSFHPTAVRATMHGVFSLLCVQPGTNHALRMQPLKSGLCNEPWRTLPHRRSPAPMHSLAPQLSRGASVNGQLAACLCAVVDEARCVEVPFFV